MHVSNISFVNYCFTQAPIDKINNKYIQSSGMKLGRLIWANNQNKLMLSIVNVTHLQFKC